MKCKKIITLGLVTVVMLQALCACGQSGSSDGDKVPTGEKSDTGFTENIYDMGGKTITIADSYWIGGESDTPEKQNCAKILKEIEKDYNCHIEVFAPNMSTIEQDITTSVAAGKVYANIINIQHEFSILFFYLKFYHCCVCFIPFPNARFISTTIPNAIRITIPTHTPAV